MELGYLISPVVQIVDHNGNPITGAKIFVYNADTTVLVDTYNDFEGHLNTNPVITDSLGNCTIIADSSKIYDIIVKDAEDTLLFGKKNITIASGVDPSSSLVFENGYGISIERSGNLVTISVDTNTIATQDDLATKQDKLYAGNNISIDGENKINVVNRIELLAAYPIRVDRTGDKAKLYLDETWASQIGNNDLRAGTDLYIRGGTGGVKYIGVDTNGFMEGTYNFIAGDNTQISGDQNAVFGRNVSAFGNRNAGFGGGNVIDGYSNIEAGLHNNTSGSCNAVFGMDNNVSGSSNAVLGNQCKANGNQNIIAGYKNEITNDNNAAFGENNSAVGYSNIVAGNINTVSGTGNAVFGRGNTVTGQSNTIIGEFATTGDYYFAVGNGTAANNRSNALEVRKNGDIYYKYNHQMIQLAPSNDTDPLVHGLQNTATNTRNPTYTAYDEIYGHKNTLNGYQDGIFGINNKIDGTNIYVLGQNNTMSSEINGTPVSICIGNENTMNDCYGTYLIGNNLSGDNGSYNRIKIGFGNTYFEINEDGTFYKVVNGVKTAI